MLTLLDWQRRRQLRRAAPGPLRDYLARPLPPKGRDYRATDYLAIDLETTGLDAGRDLILSVGYVVVRGKRIDLGSACHRVVRIDRSIPEASAVIHQITDDQSARGLELVDVLAELLAVMAGKVMIAHHASIECGFLSNACRRLWRAGMPVRVVDTQVLAHRTFERRQTPFKASDLRLHSLGERFNLPRYGAHNALSDALAAAELFLAQAAYRDTGKELPLKEFLC
ncbi:MAG TPA: 3'-5' exonuclease [Lamprocystis sp. (in: g-proteobacteria)]|nr:3'-5' exonuclease [Lamprocystis sp. (in: g-proteobacteria)]